MILNAELVEISGTQFIGNSASSGGALYLKEPGPTKIENSLFQGNSA
jgi:predicted outer membrane repeat protein